jgi:hypothetical protein
MNNLKDTASDLYITSVHSCFADAKMLSLLLMLSPRFTYVPRAIKGRAEEFRISLQK